MKLNKLFPCLTHSRKRRQSLTNTCMHGGHDNNQASGTERVDWRRATRLRDVIDSSAYISSKKYTAHSRSDNDLLIRVTFERNRLNSKRMISFKSPLKNYFLNVYSYQ